MAATSIEWCDHSINPIRARHIATGKIGHYCEKIAAGCTHCYSSRMQIRFGTPQFGSGQKRDEFEIYLDEGKLAEVRRRKKPTRYFWCDMTDIFGDWMTPELLGPCFETMDATPQHTHMLLTKRPENVRRMLVPHCLENVPGHVRQNEGDGKRIKRRENVWLGTSVSDQPTADAAIPHLLKCRDLAPVLFLSAEPLLGSIQLPLGDDVEEAERRATRRHRCGIGMGGARIDWVIVGGESGPGARPCRATWVRDLARQCADAGAACFVKQLGGNAEEGYGVHRKLLLKDKKGGDWNEWPEDLRVREMPEVNRET